MRAVLVLLLCLVAASADARRQRRPRAKVKPVAAASVKHLFPHRDASPEVLFTFDDGPHLERTPKVLDALDRYQVKAIFFVNGWHLIGNSQAAVKSRALLREIARRGHAIGNHTTHHLFLCGQRGPKVAVDEIEGTARMIEQATGLRPELFRTPFGAHCPTLNAILAGQGIKPIGWDIDPQDWKVQDTKKVRDHVVGKLRSLHGRAILLLHDIHACTVAAVPQILEWIEQENAARHRRGEKPVRIIDYGYLLPPHPLVPPIIDDVGRLLIDTFAPARSLPRQLWRRFVSPWVS